MSELCPVSAFLAQLHPSCLDSTTRAAFPLWALQAASSAGSGPGHRAGPQQGLLRLFYHFFFNPELKLKLQKHGSRGGSLHVDTAFPGTDPLIL